MSKSTIGETIGDRKYFLIFLVVIVGLFLFFILTGKSNTVSGTNTSVSVTGASAAPASIAKDLSAVPTATLDSIGTGSSDAKPQHISAPSLTQNGKPEVFFEGAEYCPYCATERWAAAQALSRFGTFTNLQVTHSSSTDVYANTQTLSFYKSTYSSPYITFVPVEIYTNIPTGTGYTTLQTPTTAQENIVNTYDAAPYLPSSEAGSIPFFDYGGHYITAGATYNPAVLQGVPATEIASLLSSPESPIAVGVDGAANTITAAICKDTNNKPLNVCDASIKKIESSL